ncbi:MAG: response regulator [Acidobacteria bacterium]|nr:response regulator [Acidobacteriota bacterium]
MTRDTSGIPAKTVLLVDANSHSRSARVRTLRELGMMVDCASTASAGLSRLDTGCYSLVLVDVSTDRASAERLAATIRSSKPRQLVAFLVGTPPFVVKSLKDAVRPAVNTAEVIARPLVSRQRAHSAPAGRATFTIDFGRRIRQIQAGKEEVA